MMNTEYLRLEQIRRRTEALLLLLTGFAVGMAITGWILYI